MKKSNNLLAIKMTITTLKWLAVGLLDDYDGDDDDDVDLTQKITVVMKAMGMELQFSVEMGRNFMTADEAQCQRKMIQCNGEQFELNCANNDGIAAEVLGSKCTR